MLSVFVGFFQWFLTYVTKKLSKKLGFEVDGALIIAVLSIIAGAIYVYLEQNNPELVEGLTKFLVETITVSQSIYLLTNKYTKKG